MRESVGISLLVPLLCIQTGEICGESRWCEYRSCAVSGVPSLFMDTSSSMPCSRSRFACVLSLIGISASAACFSCAPSPHAANNDPRSGNDVQLTSPSKEITPPEDQPLPTLAGERSAADSRLVQDVSLTLNTKVEELTSGSAPSWYAAAATSPTRAAGTATAATLAEALDQAVTIAGASIEARGANPSTLVVEQASWQRLSTGQFAAWASMGDGSLRTQPPIPRAAVVQRNITSSPSDPLPSLSNPRAAITTDGSGTVMAENNVTQSEDGTTVSDSTIDSSDSIPSLAQARAAQSGTQKRIPQTGSAWSTSQSAPAAPLPPDTGVPAWWSDKPSIRGGRIGIGIITNGANGREAARAALRSAREQLKAVVNEEPRAIITDKSAMVTLPDGSVRLYAFMSCLLPVIEEK